MRSILDPDERRMSGPWSIAPVGVPTLDGARYSAPPPALERLELFAGGLSVLTHPRMAHVRAVYAPGQGGDVFIRFAEPMASLAARVAAELPARAMRGRSLVVIPDGLATDWQAEAGQPLCHHIHVPRAMRDLWGEMGRPGSVRPLCNATSAEIDALFSRIVAELDADDAFRRLKLQGLTLAVAAAVYRLAGAAQRVRAPSQAMTPARLRRVRAYVEANLASEICLEAMAGCVGLSPGHFGRAFRAEVGMSPYAWVVRARVERAKERLRHSRRSLSEIALECGFATQSHLTETFRRATGAPPGRWRREAARGPAPEDA